MSVQILKIWGDGFERIIRQSGSIDKDQSIRIDYDWFNLSIIHMYNTAINLEKSKVFTRIHIEIGSRFNFGQDMLVQLVWSTRQSHVRLISEFE